MQSSSSSRPPGESRAADATGTLAAVYVRPSRWPVVGAVVLALVLIGVPVYLWTRPRSVSESVDGLRRAEDAAPAEQSTAPEAALAAPTLDAGAVPGGASSAGGGPRPTRKHPGPKGR